MRVGDNMPSGCRIGTLDDVIFGFLVFRLRGTIDPSHEGDHTCTHSVATHQLIIITSPEAGTGGATLFGRCWIEGIDEVSSGSSVVSAGDVREYRTRRGFIYNILLCSCIIVNHTFSVIYRAGLSRKPWLSIVDCSRDVPAHPRT